MNAAARAAGVRWNERGQQFVWLDRRAWSWWTRRPPRYPAAWRVLTVFGSRPVVYGVLAGRGALDARRGQPEGALGALAVLAAGDVVREALCGLVGRERPPAHTCLVPVRGSSFPSRHATLSALAAAALVSATPPGRRRPVAVATGALCAGVGASRLRLGAHWPSDVLAGWLFALAWWALNPVPRQGTARTGRVAQAGSGP